MTEMGLEEYEKTKKRNKKIGFFWLIAPFATLILTLVVFSITSFIFSTSVENDSVLISQIVKLILSLIGLVSTIGIMIGIPLGIVYLNKRIDFPGMKFDERSGKGNLSEIPDEIKGWNWGAAGLSWIWGASHRVWISFLVFIPLVNLVMFIYLGLKGSELAWRANRWESMEKFIEVERKWKPWGIAFLVLGILAAISRLMGAGR